MKILVTGAKGFVGKNLCSELRNRGYKDIVEYDRDSTDSDLDVACKEADFVFHLAGVNRTKNNDDFKKVNADLTDKLLQKLKEYNNKASILLSSSIQAENDSPYGLSKKAGEDYVIKYGNSEGVKVYVFRFSNLFGKWSNPNYNSVVATWCHNISRGQAIRVDDPEHVLNLIYIDDVVNAMISILENKEENYHKEGQFYKAIPEYPIKLKDLATRIYSFAELRKTNQYPDMSDPLTSKLYSTYTSYLPNDSFAYTLDNHKDERGSFAEFIRSHDSSAGQIAINTAKKGEIKGNHWHHSKVEKFLVVYGKAELHLRNLFSDEVLTYKVSGEDLKVVDIPTGYVHNIENVGDTDMVFVVWASENYDPNLPDTFPLEV